MSSSNLNDISYQLNTDRSSNRQEHKYSKNIRIISSAYSQTLLSKLCHESCKLPEMNFLLERLYQVLFWEMVNDLFPLEVVARETRMKKFHPEGVFRGPILKQDTPCVVVDLARAGTFPSHICFENLNFIKDSESNRQDHFYINRKVNDKGQVIGVDVSGSKIGGGQDGAIVLFPDPMGATGGSLSHCVNHYKTKVEGKALKYVGLHIIITPEYIKKISADHPDIYVYALRLDRGLSSKKVLQSTLGTYPDEEVGLNKNQYIVPGAGGVGELLNNSFV